MVGKSRSAIAERVKSANTPSKDKLDLFLDALRQPDVQKQASEVRDHLFARQRATQRIKTLSAENKRVLNTLGFYKFNEAQRAVFENLIEANRAECRTLVPMRHGKNLSAQALMVAAMAQDIMKQRPGIGLEEWPYEIGIILANIDDLKSTLRFIRNIKQLFEPLSKGQPLSGDEKKFLIALAALYRQLH